MEVYFGISLHIQLYFAGSNISYFDIRKKELENVNITLHPQPKGSKVDKRYYTISEKNNHNYTRLINQPELCSQHEKVFLLFAIRTIYSHFPRRQVLREQFNHPQYVKYKTEMVVKHIFLFAKTNDSITEKLINEESKQYNDIIQEDFVESYINVSLKAIMAWKWSLEFCPNTEYVMVENDESYVDIDKLVSFLLKDLSRNQNDDHFAVCYAVGNSKSIHRNMKQFIILPAEVLYKGNFYPPYCNGVCYAAHVNVINKLYKASFSNPPFMPTDVWIGVMSEKLRLQIPRINSVFILKNIENYFSDSYYPVKEPMIAITDIGKNKGHEVSIMQNILSSMKQHWSRTKNIQKTWSLNCQTNILIPTQKPRFISQINIVHYIIVIIPSILVLIFLCRKFAKIFPKWILIHRQLS